MKTVIWTENAAWDDVLRQAQQENVLVLRDGRPLVLMTPFDDEDLEWYTREHDPGFLAKMAEIRRQFEQGKVASHKHVKTELGRN